MFYIIRKLVEYRNYISTAVYWYHMGVFMVHNPITGFALRQIGHRIKTCTEFYILGHQLGVRETGVKLSKFSGTGDEVDVVMDLREASI